MNSLCWSLSIIICSLLEPCVSIQIQSDSEPTAIIADFIEENTELLRFSKTKDIIVIIGNTNPGDKTLLASFITNENKLKVYGEAPAQYSLTDNSTRAPIYSLIDKFDLIQRHSKSIVPELICDKKSTLDHYVFPNLNLEPSDAKYEISIMYLIQRVLSFAETVKFVFTINYWAVSGGKKPKKEQTLEVVAFVTNATRLLKSIDNFKKSITLVVLNVPHQPDKGGSVLETFADTFRAVKTSFKNSPNAIKFIDIILEQKDKRFTKMSMLRLANQTGLVKDIPWMQKERKIISMAVYDTIEYAEISNFNFDYTLSSNTIKYIPKLIEEVEIRLRAAVTKVGHQIKSVYSIKESQIEDPEILHESMALAYQTLSEVTSNDQNKFSKQIVNAIKVLNISSSVNSLQAVLNHIETLRFLRSAIPKKGPTEQFVEQSLIANEIDDVKRYLQRSRSWYSSTLAAHYSLSQWKVQSDISIYRADVAKLMAELTIQKYETKNVNETSLIEFSKKAHFIFDTSTENEVVSYPKCRALKAILIETLRPVLDWSCSSDGQKLTVKGFYIKISDIKKLECFSKAKVIEIMAVNKLFVDDDINRSGGVEIYLMAPEWEILGKRQIVLIGNDGPSHEELIAPVGEHGLPGKPGGSAGEIVCIGETFHNDENLEIRLEGGKGGPGQHGGNGFEQFLNNIFYIQIFENGLFFSKIHEKMKILSKTR